MDQSAFAHLESLLKEEIKGEFTLGKMLGRGGMAVVYLATETHLSRKVALKVLPPELTFGHGVDRFMREAKTAAALDHPHIIPIYRIGQGGKIFWYAMKFLEGASLDDILKERGAYGLDEAIEILEQVADALDYAHDHHVIHRDIKPANIMLDKRGSVVITDFGIAKALTEGALTASGSVIGTPYFMSPEQGMGKAVAGAADQYSVAVMAFRMLAGHVPFDGDSAIDILHKQCMAEPPRLEASMPHLPTHVCDAINKALSKKAADRFPTVSDFVGAMKDPDYRYARPSVATVMLSREEIAKSTLGAKRKTVAKAPAGKTAPSAAAGNAQRAGQRGVQRVVTPARKSRAGIYAALAVILLGGGGFAGWKVIGGEKQPEAGVGPTSEVPSTTSAGGTPIANPATQPGTAAPPPTAVTQTPAPAPEPIRAVPRPIDRSAANRPAANRPAANRPAANRPAANRPPGDPSAATSGAPAGAAAMATLQIILEPPGIVSVDGVSAGEKSRHRAEVQAGRHSIRVEREGFVAKDTSVTVTAGQTARIRLSMTARP